MLKRKKISSFIINLNEDYGTLFAYISYIYIHILYIKYVLYIYLFILYINIYLCKSEPGIYW